MRQFKLARIAPVQLRDELNAREDIRIVDIQGRPDDTAESVAIPGAIRINPSKLERYKDMER